MGEVIFACIRGFGMSLRRAFESMVVSRLGKDAGLPIGDDFLEPFGQHQIAKQRVPLSRLEHEAHGHAVDDRLDVDPSSQADDGMDVGREMHPHDLLAGDAHAPDVSDKFELFFAEGQKSDILMSIEKAMVAMRRAADEDDGTRGRRPSHRQISHRVAFDPRILKQPETV